MRITLLAILAALTLPLLAQAQPQPALSPERIAAIVASPDCAV